MLGPVLSGRVRRFTGGCALYAPQPRVARRAGSAYLSPARLTCVAPGTAGGLARIAERKGVGWMGRAQADEVLRLDSVMRVTHTMMGSSDG